MLKHDPFSTFGNDLKAVRTALGISRSKLAEKVCIGSRYLEKIENTNTLPSLLVFYDLIYIFKLPVEQYFFPEIEQIEDANLRQTIHKLRMCSIQYLPIIEATIDAALITHRKQKHNKKEGSIAK